MDFVVAVRLQPERHEVAGFDCGSEAQTRWLRRYAATALAAGTAVTYVVTPAGSTEVVGYHALAAASVEPSNAPPRLLKGAGRGPVPVVLLARLGVDIRFAGRGLGSALVKDAMIRAQRAAEAIGARALMVHAETDVARAFYLRLAEFEPSPTDPLHLVLLMRDLEVVPGSR
jgi:GNAT superfamily N-acetyltransferase